MQSWPMWLGCGLLGVILLLRFPVHFIIYPPYLMDFDVYRSSAMRIAGGQALALYQPLQTAASLFKYAPCWAIAWLPLAWLSVQAGSVLWSALTVLWLVWACWIAQRLTARAGLPAPFWLPLAAVSVLVRPVTAEFLNGQTDILWAWLTLGFLTSGLRQQRWRSAACLALAIALKLPALIFLPYLMLRRRWDLVWRTGLVFTLVNAGTVWLLAPAQPLRLLNDWAHVLQSSGPARAFEIGNQSLVSLAGRLLSADMYHLNLLSLPAGGVFAATAVAALILFTLVGWGRPAATTPARWVADGALLTILMVLCSPTTWIATYSALILPVTLAVAGLLRPPRSPWRRGALIVLSVVLLALSAMTHNTLWHALGIRSFRGESYVYLVLMVLPWLGLALFAHLHILRPCLTTTASPPDNLR